MDRHSVPADPEGDPDAEAEFLQPSDVPPEVAEAWEEDDPTEGQAPTG